MNGLAALVALALATAAPGVAAAATAEQQAAEASLKTYLRSLLTHSDMSTEDRAATATQVQVAWTDLNNDGRLEALAYVSGGGWCGSGGCRLLVLEQDGTTYRLRGKLGVTRPPIALLPSRSSGWRDLTVYVAGGGIIPGYRVVVPFDGRQYAQNPTTTPAYKLPPGTAEDVIIPNTEFPFLGR